MNSRYLFCSLAVAGTLLGIGMSPGAQGADAPEVFLKNCSPCHGKDGKAKTPIGRKLGAKDLSLSRLTNVEIEKQILDGRKDDHGAQKMPSFRDKFSSEEIRAL